ncbi:hypothetical protein [Actinomadura harenae]|uniref:Uncharacterized protein n=1 Tax=Actinomadura harenae TaxID=2483351 RepID=A0A3M2MFW2_9ACTN|nr:hypothetical protein [Actinomadura harenae]RMI47870.1 hypothetical protein EBO15_00855 [Actinomadura harenae]
MSLTTQAALTVLPVTAGALIGFVPAYLMERRREREALRKRWDEPMHQLCSETVVRVRKILHGRNRVKHAGADRDAVLHEMEDEYHELRLLVEQIRLLGTRDLQVAARMMLRHSYAVLAETREEPDPRADEYAEPPYERLVDAVQRFRIEARKQLSVETPEEIAPEDP